MPQCLKDEVADLRLDLTWTKHALREALHDKHGVLPASAYPRRFHGGNAPAHNCGSSVGPWELVEAELTARRLTKFVVRRPIDAVRSLVLVIRPTALFSGNVVTCWTNLNTDRHATLDRSKFCVTLPD
jgi:hypothetical protein